MSIKFASFQGWGWGLATCDNVTGWTSHVTVLLFCHLFPCPACSSCYFLSIREMDR